MSTNPSKPSLFFADIGVLATETCKSSLRCPPHIVIPFEAFYYNISEYDFPVPYVGNINLRDWISENKNDHNNWKSLSKDQNKVYKNNTITENEINRTRDKSKIQQNIDDKFKNCSKLKKNLGYRLPLKGQLQIIIKNANKNVIKAFLLPYDLRDMPPKSKTFVRQKYYCDVDHEDSIPVEIVNGLDSSTKKSVENKIPLEIQYQKTGILFRKYNSNFDSMANQQSIKDSNNQINGHLRYD